MNFSQVLYVSCLLFILKIKEVSYSCCPTECLFGLVQHSGEGRVFSFQSIVLGLALSQLFLYRLDVALSLRQDQAEFLILLLFLVDRLLVALDLCLQGEDMPLLLTRKWCKCKLLAI